MTAERICGNGVCLCVAELSGNHRTVANIVVGIRRDEIDGFDAAAGGFGNDRDVHARVNQTVMGI